MRITDEVRMAISKKCQEESGGALKLARAAGFTPAQISRYHSGRTQTITEECWTRLFPHVMRYLPDGFTCKVLVNGKPETRVVRQRMEPKTVYSWKNEEYTKLFGSGLPTRDQIESFLAKKIKTYSNSMNLLVFLLNFDEIMDGLLAHPQSRQEIESGGGIAEEDLPS